MIEGHEDDLGSERTLPAVPVRTEVLAIVLRDYQVRGVEMAGQAWLDGVKRILLQLPTGGGKTICAARFLSGAVAKGKRGIFLAHRREIVSQTFAKLYQDGVPLSDLGCLMGDGVIAHPVTGKPFKATNPNAKIIVASVPTWTARPSKPPADVVFIDEAHHCGAKTWRAVIDHYVAAGAVVIGLTATPIRGDGKGLDDLFDRLICVEKMSSLVSAGHLCQARVFVGKRIDGLDDVKIQHGDYEIGALQEVMREQGLVADIVEQWQKHSQGRTTVAFASGVDHSLDIVRRFVEAGVTAEHIDGKTPPDVRDAILARMASGATQVVSNAMVLTEGWDLPRAKLCILARPTKSLGLYLQMVGRVLRPWNGVVPKILDHAATATVFGPPHIDREWSLEGKPKKKKGGPVPVVEPMVPACEECGCLLYGAPAVCPECGAETKFALVELPGDLVEMDWVTTPPPPTAAELLERAKARSAAEKKAEQKRLQLEDGDEVRRTVNRMIGAIASSIALRYVVVYGEVLTDINRAIYRRLGNRSRTAASRDALEGEMAWLAQTNPATGVRVAEEGVVFRMNLVLKNAAQAPVPAPRPAPVTATQLSFLGIEGPRAKPAAKVPPPPPPRVPLERLSPSMNAALDKALGPQKAARPDDEEDFGFDDDD